MREYGIPKVLTWRWAPCAALSIGALSFAAFAMLAIPERIGNVGAGESTTTHAGLGSSFVRTQIGSTPSNDWSNDSSTVTTPSSPVSRVTAQASDLFPKRGFSPPLERAEQPTPPPTPPPQGLPVPPPAPPPATSPPPAEAAPPAAERPEPPQPDLPVLNAQSAPVAPQPN